MKKNILPLISLCLTVLLLVVCIQQNNALKEYQAQVDHEMESLRDELKIQMDNLAFRVDDLIQDAPQDMEEDPAEDEPVVEAGYFVSDFSVDAFYINIDEWMLETYVATTLNESGKDMVVTLLAEFNGETVSVPMARYDTFNFGANLSIPVDNPNEVEYTIQVEMGGKTTQQDVYDYVDIVDLMALYCSGGSFGGPYYDNGLVYGECTIHLDNWSGSSEPQPLLDPHFEVLKNGEVVQTLAAVRDGDWSTGTCAYKVKDDQQWEIRAQEGDKIVLRFRCHNEYGLGWEFYLMSYEIRNGRVYDVELDMWPTYGFYRP